ncbi:YveK family protein [Enterococcus timonensis]|uniref:YveK family protein n=1 Tax=Enterococcus timonensis TaxID=1852364 RepID=UPI0008DA5344|nr:Wzz/FepE/Etk N-terminal domain-containing protein [Enterococcus timonensis]
MEETISLGEIFGILKKRLGLILIMTVVGTLLAGFLTFFIITPKYSSEAQLIVTLPQSEQTSVNDVNANLMMLNTYKDLIKGNAVLSEVQTRAEAENNFKGSVGTLNGMINVTQSQNSQMFSIVATSDNAYEAEAIANITAAVFQEKVIEILKVDKVSVISDAEANLTPVSPNKKLNIAIGLVLGLMIGVGIAFLIELLDKTVKDNRFIQDELGLVILGSVQEMTAKELSVKLKKVAPRPSNGNSTPRPTENGDKEISRRSRTRV